MIQIRISFCIPMTILSLIFHGRAVTQLGSEKIFKTHCVSKIEERFQVMLE